MSDHIKIIGAGLAGCEAAWQIAKRGIKVVLYEMKPKAYTPAHHIQSFAELVCSNSLRSDQIENAVGLLKEEMRLLDSIILKCADETRVPAGGALAVDRNKFSERVTEIIRNSPNITVVNEEVKAIPDTDDGIVIIATGPLTFGQLAESIAKLTGEGYLQFFDAAAPILTYASIDMSKAFKAARYGKGSDDYINCPMDKEQYESFCDVLVNAEVAPVKDFENDSVFEGCMPIETMASRGRDTMRFGPLKPVGLNHPVTGKEAYAVVQLRQDNIEGTLYNMVGFQTHLKWAEQKRVFGMIPGLENAEYVRYGVMHRNTFLNSPKLLDSSYRSKSNSNIFFAGQITGVEGYIESASSGLVAGLNAALQLLGRPLLSFSSITATGALCNYISNASTKNFQPMNINFGIIDSLNVRIRDKRAKNHEIAMRALDEIKWMLEKLN